MRSFDTADEALKDFEERMLACAVEVGLLSPPPESMTLAQVLLLYQAAYQHLPVLCPLVSAACRNLCHAVFNKIGTRIDHKLDRKIAHELTYKDRGYCVGVVLSTTTHAVCSFCIKNPA